MTLRFHTENVPSPAELRKAKPVSRPDAQGPFNQRADSRSELSANLLRFDLLLPLPRASAADLARLQRSPRRALECNLLPCTWEMALSTKSADAEQGKFKGPRPDCQQTPFSCDSVIFL